MLIQINHNYRITSDANNIIVEERKVAGKEAKVPGQEYWVQVSFHTTLLQACESLIRRCTALSEARDVQTLMKELRETSKAVTEAVTNARLEVAR